MINDAHSPPAGGDRGFFDDAAERLHLDQSARDALSRPERQLAVRMRVPMDDGAVKVVEGWRVQHNDARGPFKGGVRFHPDVTMSEVRNLAALMAWKTALLELPFGGAKGGVRVDPRLLSSSELERVARAFLRQVLPVIGPTTDIMAPDVNTGERVMAWMVEEYARLRRHTPAIVTGKPVALGGLRARAWATGRGAFMSLDHLVRAFGWPRATCRIAVQGFGNAGRWFALAAHDAGYPIVAISDSKGAVVNERGLDPRAILAHKEKIGSVVDAEGTETIDTSELVSVDAQVLAPAALEDAVNGHNESLIRARLLLEIANNPVGRDASEALEGRGVRVVPDILANAGGVVVSYLEWMQNLTGERLDDGEVDRRLKSKMERATDAVLDRSRRERVSLREAAYEIAIERVVEAERRRAG